MGVNGATDRQVRYAMRLLAEAGYSTRYMNAKFKDLGATMRERSGSVEDWVAGMNRQEASALIERLLAQEPR